LIIPEKKPFEVSSLVGEWQTIWSISGKLQPIVIRFTSMETGEEVGTFGYLYSSGNQCRIDVVYTGFDGTDHIFNGTFGYGAAIKGRKIASCVNASKLVYNIHEENGVITLRQADSGNELSITELKRLEDPNSSKELFPASELLGEWQTYWEINGSSELIGIKITNIRSNSPSGTMAYLYKQGLQCRIDISYAGHYKNVHIFFGHSGNAVSVQGETPPPCINTTDITYNISFDGTNYILKQLDKGNELSTTVLARP
jgi:hypothetical protein